MLAVQQAHGRPSRRDGRSPNGLAELRDQLAGDRPLSATARQRLRELSQRLARVQALSGEISGVAFSSMVEAAVAGSSPTD